MKGWMEEFWDADGISGIIELEKRLQEQSTVHSRM